MLSCVCVLCVRYVGLGNIAEPSHVYTLNLLTSTRAQRKESAYGGTIRLACACEHTNMSSFGRRFVRNTGRAATLAVKTFCLVHLINEHVVEVRAVS